MKTVLAKSFRASRVGEALGSLAEYVQQARDLANEIKPVQTSEPTLTATEVPGQPRLSQVRTVDYISFEVSGQHLGHIERVRFIPADNLDDCTYLATAKASNAASLLTLESPVKFRVTFTDKLPAGTRLPPGTYHAWVRDEAGQEDLLTQALSVPETGTCPMPPSTPAASVTIEVSDYAPQHAKRSETVHVILVSRDKPFPADSVISTADPQLKVVGHKLAKEQRSIAADIAIHDKAERGDHTFEVCSASLGARTEVFLKVLDK